MKPAAIREAEKLAKATGATRLMIVCVDNDGNFAFTTYAATKAQCRALANWAEANAPMIAQDMDDSL